MFIAHRKVQVLTSLFYSIAEAFVIKTSVPTLLSYLRPGNNWVFAFANLTSTSKGLPKPSSAKNSCSQNGI
jgi:hypothetical protein